MAGILWKIIRETDYEVIILDLTEQVRGLFSLLELCDEIYSCIPIVLTSILRHYYQSSILIIWNLIKP